MVSKRGVDDGLLPARMETVLPGRWDLYQSAPYFTVKFKISKNNNIREFEDIIQFG
jgi:hypothetical protein